jgi:hypothetical protein
VGGGLVYLNGLATFETIPSVGLDPVAPGDGGEDGDDRPILVALDEEDCGAL